MYKEAFDILYDHTCFTLSVLRPSNLGLDSNTDGVSQIITRGWLRSFGPLQYCNCLRRIQHLEIHVEFDLNKHLSRDLRRLEELMPYLTAPREAVLLRMHLRDGRVPVDLGRQWQRVLSRFEKIGGRCEVHVELHLMWETPETRRVGDLLEVLS